jgi:non-heme Fe2+,alpha-ketoglutarate-dependent halogenase
MPRILSETQIAAYARDGVAFPIRIMSADQARDLRRKFEALEDAIGGEAQARFRIKAHIPFPWMCDLVRNEKMLDAIEDLVGPDIIVWGSSFFTKKAHDQRFVSWHQDSTYYGLEPPDSLTAWIALSPSKVASGCLRVLPGTHKGSAVMDHEDTYDANNLLSRGQTIRDVDASAAIDVELAPGECSIHHNMVIHGSNPNPSGDARIGLAVHLATPATRQTQFEGATATLVRGRDNHGHWAPDPVPAQDFDPACLEELDTYWQRYRSAMTAQNATE